MDITNTGQKISFRITYSQDSEAGQVVSQAHEGLTIHLDKDLKFTQTNQADALIRVHVFHELDDLKILQQYLETTDANLIVLTYNSETTSIERKTGFSSFKLAALARGILLKEYPVDTFSEGQFSFKKDLILTVTNLTFYLTNGSDSNSQLEAKWQRYLISNIHLKLYQRLFFKNRAIRATTQKSSLKNKEFYTNIPVSLQNFKLGKSLHERMLKATKQQSELWCKIAADWVWLKSNLEL